ncbi:macro domain-containing protein [bacterium]|nr:macro domain-containing protein [bacterium]
MITVTKGNLLEADVEALVNTVNSVGYMGKGIALQFKKAFPQNFLAYQKACRRKEVSPGKMFVFETDSMVNPKYVINFPTKRHWRGKSQIEYIQSGLKALVGEIKKRGIKSVAIPPLGSGLGGLNWNIVKPMIEKAFKNLSEIEVLLFEPAGAPAARSMPVRTQRPHLTLSRALLIRLMKQYSDFAYRFTLLEIQKVAYFLQEGGEPLRLKYDQGIYGPYAPNLNKVLEKLEGHFISGYGDTQRPDVEIELLPGAWDEAEKFLAGYAESLERLEKIAKLIEGFETPYGMELLSSTHWVAIHSSPSANNLEDAIHAIQNWSPRKRRMFRTGHIAVAWERLKEAGWLTEQVS